MKFVVFATPAFDFNVTLGYLASALRTEKLLMDRRMSSGHILVGGDPYLAKVRNVLVTRALREYPDMTDFFFLDADIEWPAEAVLRLLDHPADVVAGIYPKKNDTTEFPCELEMQNGRLIESDGWYKARAVPTGFLRIKRHVLEKMAAVNTVYDDGTGNMKHVHNIFQMGYCGDDAEKNEGKGQWWGEDYAWCRQWHNMGGDIWIWPDIEFGHRGGKTWRNNFAKSVKAFEKGDAIVRDLTAPADTSPPVVAAVEPEAAADFPLPSPPVKSNGVAL